MEEKDREKKRRINVDEKWERNAMFRVERERLR